ncbi:MAG: hypothetical protein ACREQ7_07650 [Candidatus Binatia bacterium]
MKRNINRSLISILCFSTVLLLIPSLNEGYETLTHEDLSNVATPKSILDDLLKSMFTSWGFPNGILEPFFDGKSAIDFIATEGAKNEDKPGIRSRHHFHNPRLAWNQAGLTWPVLGQIGSSSVVWGQDHEQNIGGKHSWQDARNTYFQALTAASEEDRNSLLADTFRSLGHLIHLVQDATSPAHARNDTHFPGDGDYFHRWGLGSDARTMIAGIGGSSQGNLPLPAFDNSLFDQQSANQFAPVPVSRVIDATDADRATIQTGYDIGVAEYSSANFFSDDTVFASPSEFSFPGLSNLEQGETVVDPVTGETHSYLRFKPGFGETDYKLAHASSLRAITNETVAPTEGQLDDNVMRDYGTKLFPRAVSYSKGLIDYFFRGDLGGVGPCVNPVAEFPTTWYPFTVGSLGLSGMPNETAGLGELRVIIAYKVGGVTSFISSDPVQVDFSTAVGDIDFRFHAGVPSNASSTTRWLVYKGQLGKENGAVVIGEAPGVC